MTAEQAGDYLQLSRAQIYKMVQRREIPYTRVRSSLRFLRSELERWLKSQTVWPHRGLLEEFELLYERFHLKKFLRAKGIEYEELGKEELVRQLVQAIEELQQAEGGELGP